MKFRTLLILLFCTPVLLAACGGDATTAAQETPAVTLVSTPTPDLCSTENLPDEAGKVNKLMREFDDYSALASNTPQAQMVVIIPELQRVLRDAEDQTVPACLVNLKKIQILHMKVVVQTLMAFIGSSDVELINSGISQARELHTQYDIELARLLGVTFVVPHTPTPAPVTPNANAVPTASAAFTVTNPGPSGVNLRNAPDLNAPEVSALAVQAATTALGKTADNLWILVEIPGQSGQTAWVYSTLVQLSVPLDQLPVITP